MNPPSGSQKAERPAGPVVLVVDDVADNRELYAEYLRFAGLEVETAAGLGEALTLAGACAPDVIVVDLAMPGLDGRAIARLKAASSAASPRLVALDGRASSDDVTRAPSIGADEIVRKPCLPIDLLKRVQALLPPPPSTPPVAPTKSVKRRKRA